MKLDSIKYRLLLIILVCLFGMALLVGTQLYSTDRLIDLSQQRMQLVLLHNQLLQLRRHEKDFLLRADLRYVEMLNEQAAALITNLNQLARHLERLEIIPASLNELSSAVSAYQDKFAQLVTLQSRIGFDETKGQQGQFREAVHALETQLRQSGQAEWQVLLLQIRRSEKDFMLRKRLEYVERQHQLLLQFQSAIDDAPQKDVLQGLLSGYQAGFEQLVHSYQQIGLRQDDGLKGEFRSIAQDMEMRLHQLDEVLKPLLNAEQQRVERTGLLIMLFTLATLMLVLIQSLVTFQRAFSAFIQFFYRCKRQYQRLDERKLGFAEFRSLAAVANEMVEARLAVEQELKAAKRELAKLNPNSDNQ
ncbi:hypothetical protein [Bowmanella yangjiangensis]|uniref:HBM domain-containing protein n=1 Tax=Bowmanella yangjiangensis TaxID=2811230 RepID=A0ABS3CV32_9ALTE|nr:hypothetical protein [Bowmanella yangjiangensis]MBN7820978.1 hypothetical protein [Bowmanella yangjiangensis]